MLSKEQEIILQNVSDTIKLLEEYLSAVEQHIKNVKGEVKRDLLKIKEMIEKYMSMINDEQVCLQYSS